MVQQLPQKVRQISKAGNGECRIVCRIQGRVSLKTQGDRGPGQHAAEAAWSSTRRGSQAGVRRTQGGRKADSGRAARAGLNPPGPDGARAARNRETDEQGPDKATGSHFHGTPVSPETPPSGHLAVDVGRGSRPRGMGARRHCQIKLFVGRVLSWPTERSKSERKRGRRSP